MEHKTKLLFVITQFFKGGAETALLNLFKNLSPNSYEIDFLIFDQIEIPKAISLVSEIPSWIHTCNAAEHEGIMAYAIKIMFKIYRKLTKHQLFRYKAYSFIRQKEYDFAFSYGEWLSPEFIATKVKARHKAVWIHTDIDKLKYLDEKVLFGWDSYYQNYIFVSNLSMQSAIKKYPFLQNRSVVVHNMCDDAEIKIKSQEFVPDIKNFPYILTVANIRPEKNHLRQIEVLNQLKKRGLNLKWINVGCAANPYLNQKIHQLLDKYHLKDSFIMVGADNNPFKYMQHAIATCVLSDYESWSIVITESKIVGTPVVATRTSGALEQIIDGETGVLCDFDTISIVNKIEQLMCSQKLQLHIKNNLKYFATTKTTTEEFYQLTRGGQN